VFVRIFRVERNLGRKGAGSTHTEEVAMAELREESMTNQDLVTERIHKTIAPQFRTYEVTVKLKVEAGGSDEAKWRVCQSHTLKESDIYETRALKPKINDMNMEKELELRGGTRIFLGGAASRFGPWHYERRTRIEWIEEYKIFSSSSRAFELLNSRVAEVWLIADSGWVWSKTLSPGVR
jgi:hypothetical protein